MSDLIDRFTGAIGSILDNPLVHTAVQFSVGYIIVIWLAAAFWAFQDMRRRTTMLLPPYLAAGAVVLASPVFFLLAVAIYRIIRPAETVTEATERRLSQLAIAQELDRPSCPMCRSLVADDWMACPYCGATLRVSCERCSHLVELSWSICPWCAAERRAVRPVLPEPVPTPLPVPAAEPGPIALRPAAAGPSSGIGARP